MGNLTAAIKELIDNPTTHEVHSMAPWWIARAGPNAHKQAKESLTREGFEVWYPKAKIIKHPALNTLPSKTRHRLRHATIESERPIFGPYLFIRRIFGAYDIFRLFDLDGVSGICTRRESIEPGKVAFAGNGGVWVHGLDEEGRPCTEHHGGGSSDPEAPGNAEPIEVLPTVSNADIEYLRLRESDGAFNEHHTVSKFSVHSPNLVDPMAQKTHHAAPKVLGRLDTDRETILFVESLGRVTRLIASLDSKVDAAPDRGYHAKLDGIVSPGAQATGVSYL